jgi:uncharacterized lipoprotein YajG
MSRKSYITLFIMVVSAMVLAACAAEPVVETVVVTEEVVVTQEVVVTEEVIVTEEVEVIVCRNDQNWRYGPPICAWGCCWWTGNAECD